MNVFMYCLQEYCWDTGLNGPFVLAYREVFCPETGFKRETFLPPYTTMTIMTLL